MDLTMDSTIPTRPSISDFNFDFYPASATLLFFLIWRNIQRHH